MPLTISYIFCLDHELWSQSDLLKRGGCIPVKDIGCFLHAVEQNASSDCARAYHVAPKASVKPHNA
jgi:hypothetical protein